MAKEDSSPKESVANASEGNQIIHTFLKNRPIGVLATAEPTGRPNASTIYYSIDENFNVLFMTKSETSKHHNLQKNNQAVLVVYEALSQTSVQVMGTVHEVTDNAEQQKAFQGMLKASLQTSDAAIPPVTKLSAGDYVAYKLVPTQVKMAVYARPGLDGLDFFETIDFSK